MNSREHIQKNSSQDTEPGELPDLLKEALAGAWPDPNGKIAEKVMAQIRAEREADQRREKAEKAERRRRRQGLIMKWGGMAACVVILSGALVIASPLMNRASDTAEVEDAGASEEAAVVTYTAAAADYSLTVGAGEEIAAYSDEEAEEEAVETTLMTRGAPQEKQMETEAAEAVPEEDADAEAGAVLYALRTADVTADAVPEENNAGVQPDSPADTEAETLADLSEQAVFGASGDNGAFLQYLLAEGLLTESVYQAWMLEQGYDDPSDWTREELCGAFGLAAE